MSSPPLKPWAGIGPDGTIICAHCNCMVGAGEACSHVAAMLYAIMFGMRMRDETSCTSMICQWLEPTTTKEVQNNHVLINKVDNIHTDFICNNTRNRFC